MWSPSRTRSGSGYRIVRRALRDYQAPAPLQGRRHFPGSRSFPRWISRRSAFPRTAAIKIQMKLGGRMKNIDIRVSSTPTLFGGKDRHAPFLDREGTHARHEASRVRGGEPDELRGSHIQALGHGPRHRGPPARERPTPFTAPSAGSTRRKSTS